MATVLATLAIALDNGAALRPPRGWQSWNAYHMRFNATLFVEMAIAMAISTKRVALNRMWYAFQLCHPRGGRRAAPLSSAIASVAKTVAIGGLCSLSSSTNARPV